MNLKQRLNKRYGEPEKAIRRRPNLAKKIARQKLLKEAQKLREQAALDEFESLLQKVPRQLVSDVFINQLKERKELSPHERLALLKEEILHNQPKAATAAEAKKLEWLKLLSQSAPIAKPPEVSSKLQKLFDVTQREEFLPEEQIRAEVLVNLMKKGNYSEEYVTRELQKMLLEKQQELTAKKAKPQAPVAIQKTRPVAPLTPEQKEYYENLELLKGKVEPRFIRTAISVGKGNWKEANTRLWMVAISQKNIERNVEFLRKKGVPETRINQLRNSSNDASAVSNLLSDEVARFKLPEEIRELTKKGIPRNFIDKELKKAQEIFPGDASLHLSNIESMGRNFDFLKDREELARRMGIPASKLAKLKSPASRGEYREAKENINKAIKEEAERILGKGIFENEAFFFWRGDKVLEALAEAKEAGVPESSIRKEVAKKESNIIRPRGLAGLRGLGRPNLFSIESAVEHVTRDFKDLKAEEGLWDEEGRSVKERETIVAKSPDYQTAAQRLREKRVEKEIEEDSDAMRSEPEEDLPLPDFDDGEPDPFSELKEEEEKKKKKKPKEEEKDFSDEDDVPDSLEDL